MRHFQLAKEVIEESLGNMQYWKLCMIIGWIIIGFNIIRFIYTLLKDIRDAEKFLLKFSAIFDGMNAGSVFIAFSAFMQKRWIVAIVAFIFSFIFFYFERKFVWAYRNEEVRAETQAALNNWDK